MITYANMHYVLPAGTLLKVENAFWPVLEDPIRILKEGDLLLVLEHSAPHLIRVLRLRDNRIRTLYGDHLQVDKEGNARLVSIAALPETSSELVLWQEWFDAVE